MARRHSSASNSSSTSTAAVRSWRRASWVISPCTRAWAPKRGGLAGIGETYRILRRSGLIDRKAFRARRTAASPEHAVTVAPSDEDVYRPNPRPIHAGRPIEEGTPEPLHRYGVEPDWSDSLRVPQSLVHGVLEAAPDPAIEGQHKPALGPFEQRRVKATQADAPQHSLLAQWPVARAIRQAIHALEQDLVHHRHPLLQRAGHAGGVVVTQQPLAEEKPLLHDADGREWRAAPALGDDSLPHCHGQAVGQRFGKALRQELMLESGEEERVGQLVERQQIIAVTDHLRKFGPTGLRWHRPAGASQRPGGQPRRCYPQASGHPGSAPG